MKLQDLFTDESKWTKGKYSKRRDGNETTHHRFAVAWCLLAGVHKCYGETKHYAVEEQIRNYLGGGSVANWNDAPERTFADVRKLIEDLDL